jgi:DNA-binding transcriptional ArsR family regulator
MTSLMMVCNGKPIGLLLQAMSRMSARARAAEDRLDGVFHALADRTRRALLARLVQGPAPVGELAAPFEMTLQAVGKHIRVLEQAGLVSRAIDGRVHRCSLEPGPLREVEQWLALYRTFWDETLEALARFAEDADDP